MRKLSYLLITAFSCGVFTSGSAAYADTGTTASTPCSYQVKMMTCSGNCSGVNTLNNGIITSTGTTVTGNPIKSLYNKDAKMVSTTVCTDTTGAHNSAYSMAGQMGFGGKTVSTSTTVTNADGTTSTVTTQSNVYQALDMNVTSNAKAVSEAEALAATTTYAAAPTQTGTTDATVPTAASGTATAAATASANTTPVVMESQGFKQVTIPASTPGGRPTVVWQKLTDADTHTTSAAATPAVTSQGYEVVSTTTNGKTTQQWESVAKVNAAAASGSSAVMGSSESGGQN